MKKLITSAIILVILFVLSYLVYVQSGKSPNNKLKVITSFYPMYYFALEVGGSKAEVLNITPSGSEPHDYELKPKDVANIQRSKLLILNGGQLEPWGDKVRENLKGSQVTIVDAGEQLANRQVKKDGVSVRDPHVWLDPVLAKQQVVKILAGFESADPSNKSVYQDNAKKLSGKLDLLNQNFRSGLADCQKKDIVTSHSSFDYLSKEYGLNQVAIAGLSPDEEPSSQKLAEIANFVKENNIKYIFFEALVSPKLSSTIATETKAKTLVLDPIEGIPQAEIDKGQDYFTKMYANLANLRIALECK